MDKDLIARVRAGGVLLPPYSDLSITNEKIWTPDTGRTQSAKMAGSGVDTKFTLNIKWGYLTESEMVKITNAMKADFFSFEFRDEGKDHKISAYRGTIQKTRLNRGNGKVEYKDVSVSVIER